jgi:hypothetical protein
VKPNWWLEGSSKEGVSMNYSSWVEVSNQVMEGDEEMNSGKVRNLQNCSLLE